MMKLFKLPFKIASLPIIAVLLVFQLVGAILIGMSSIVTKLLATVFILGTIAGLATSAPANMIYQSAGIGAFFAIAPHIAVWILDKFTDITLFLLNFLQS